MSVHEDSIAVQEDKLFKYLFVDHLKNKNEFLMHYGIQDFISIDDLLKKIGKANRIFGKGGMVNTGSVRTTVLTDWFYGKLNHIFDWMNIFKFYCILVLNNYKITKVNHLNHL